MAIITPATTYPAGALDIAGHNANIFSTTAGQGVLSEPNGGLEQANLDATFAVRDEHVMSEEAVVARAESLTVPMDIYNNAFAQREEDDPAFVPIGGLCQRVHVPYTMSAVLWQWSFFVSVWRPFVVKASEDTLFGADVPQVAVRVFIDGVEYPAFRRPFPVSADINASAVPLSGSAAAEISYERVTSLWFELSKLQTGVSKGYHELTVRLFMPRVHFNNEEEELTVQVGVGRFCESPVIDGDAEVFSTVHTRVTLGSRGVRCVMFK